MEMNMNNNWVIIGSIVVLVVLVFVLNKRWNESFNAELSLKGRRQEWNASPRRDAVCDTGYDDRRQVFTLKGCPDDMQRSMYDTDVVANNDYYDDDHVIAGY